MEKRVGVLMGGPSDERDISIRSGMAVCRALENKGIDRVPLELANTSIMNGYKEQVMRQIRASGINLAFVALHGRFGEDGKVQQILEEMNLSYTGSRIDASRSGMDKIGSKSVFKSKNIPMPRHATIKKTDLDKHPLGQVYFKELGTPLVIKPSCEGSSIGLFIVDSGRDFYAALNDAFKYGDDVIIEEYVKGREITVGILEDKALPVVEIIPKKRFFDFEAKYNKDITEYRVPAEIERVLYEVCQDVGLRAHNAIGACFFSRVDMVLSETGTPLVLEVNTIPGLTETSLLPKAAMAAGINFEQLVLKILESALW